MKDHALVNLNFFLRELGKYRYKHKHEVIRYLHKTILMLSRRHNFIITHLNRVSTTLVSYFEILASESDTDARRSLREVDFFDNMKREIQPQLEDALHTVGVLETVSEAMKGLFYFTAMSQSDVERYTSEPDIPDGFANDVTRKSFLLTRIRKRNSTSLNTVRELRDLITRINFDLWNDESPFLRALLNYVVDLNETIVKAITEADNDLQKLGYDAVWASEMIQFLPDSKPSPRKVLIDNQLLLETLKNLFTNANILSTAFSSRLKQNGLIWFASLFRRRMKKILHISIPETHVLFAVHVDTLGKTASIPGNEHHTWKRFEIDILFWRTLDYLRYNPLKRGCARITLISRNHLKLDVENSEHHT